MNCMDPRSGANFEDYLRVAIGAGAETGRRWSELYAARLQCDRLCGDVARNLS